MWHSSATLVALLRCVGSLLILVGVLTSSRHAAHIRLIGKALTAIADKADQ